MRPKKYPMDPLVRVRSERVDASVKGLSAAIKTREQAEVSRVAAQAERERVAAEARALAEQEEDALRQGVLSAADLQRQGAWEARVQWEDEERARKVAAARDAEVAAKEGEGKARAAVAHAEAEAKVVGRHRDAWVREGVHAEEARDEEGAVEAWRPRR